MTKLPFAPGHRVRVLDGLRHHAISFGIVPNQPVIIVDADRFPGDGPAGRVRVQLPANKISDWIEAGNFEFSSDAE